MAMKRNTAWAAVLALLVVLGASPALADPAPGPVFTVECGGDAFEVIGVPGQGQWTPALDAEDNTVYRPVGFSDYWYEVYASDGSLIEEGTDPGSLFKNGNRRGQGMMQCTFTGTFAGYDEYYDQEVYGSYGGTVYVKTKAS